MEALNKVLLLLEGPSYSEFEADDVFNGNKLSGIICHNNDHRYGALAILKVNDEECCQIIYGTPKLHYPFDKSGTYKWPKMIAAEFWEKLDGTNVLAYHYSYKGEDYVAYKTRLTPVIKESNLVSFQSMWIEYMAGNSWIKSVIAEFPEYNFSFEMFGSRNPITIKYPFPLEVNLLFGVRRFNADIKPPGYFASITPHVKTPHLWDLKYIKKVEERIEGENLTIWYNAMRENMSATNSANLLIEGMVLYGNVDGKWMMFKCKPEEIEKIHWAAGGSIPEIALRTTALNAFEDKENPDFEDFLILLREEYDEQHLTKASIKCQKVWYWAKEHAKMAKEVNEVWLKAKDAGFDIYANKASTLRFMSQFFDRNQMRKVGSIILKQAGVI